MATVKLRIDFYNAQAGDVIQLKDHSAKEFARRGWCVIIDEKAVDTSKEKPKKGKK